MLILSFSLHLAGIDMSMMQRFPLLITIIISVQFIDQDHYADAAANGT